MTMIKGTIYALKRKYGSPLDIYRESNETVNILTGIRSQTRSKYFVKRAIVLPSDVTRMSASTRANAFGATQSSGGEIEATTRVILIDKSDLQIILDIHDYIIHEAQRYEIKSIDLYQNAAYYLVVKEYRGSILHTIFDLIVHDKVTAAQKVTHV